MAISKSKKSQSKLEPIRAQDLASLGDNAKHLFMQRAAKDAPGFAFELSLQLPLGKVFEVGYDRSWGSSLCAFENAVSGGNLALARVWSASNRSHLKMMPYFREARNGFTPGVYLTHLAFSSPASDEVVWRSRRWLMKSVGCDLSELSVQDQAKEAILAFCSGRPLLGLRCALRLLKADPKELARATASELEWPSEASPQFWDELAGDRKAFSRKLESISYGRDNPPKIKNCGLLSHLSYWSQALKVTDPALASELDELEGALWNRGAFASPKVHAKRFSSSPYGHDDPRASMLTSAARSSAGEVSAAHDYQGPAAVSVALFTELLKHCAMAPDAVGKDGAVWDAFSAAHTEAPQANPNPFKAWGAGSSALLSLSGDGRLIEMALDRGFSPEESKWALVSPGSMIAAFQSQHLPEPELSRNLVSRKTTLAPPGFGLSPRATPSKRSKDAGAVFKDGDPAKGLPKVEWPDSGKDTAESWRYQSLASVALACGKNILARRLVRAGCPPAGFDQVLAEAGGRHQDAIHSIAARFEAEALFDATGGLETEHKSIKKVLRA